MTPSGQLTEGWEASNSSVSSHSIGFWLQAVSIGVTIIGTVLVATRRNRAQERGAAGLAA